jgi:4-hydroxy-3-polyprenylbenzoate decarboxylase
VDAEGVKRLDDVNFTALSGEILGIAGIAGSGQRELLESISGLYPVTEGSVLYYPPEEDGQKAPEPVELVGKPPMEDCYLAKATERIFLPLLQQMQPEIIDINMPLEGVFHDCCIVSIKKQYPMQARKVMHALWGMGQMMNVKMIIVVDAHVNVQDLKEVWWRVYNNIDAKHDLEIVEGPLDVLDHSSPMAKWGSKMGIDATKTWPEEGHTREWPEEISMSEEIKARVDAKWKELGLD